MEERKRFFKGKARKQWVAMEIPKAVVSRLPLYARTLARLSSDGVEVVSSQELAEMLQVTPAQIRKDLSLFGRFGKQGRGYPVAQLLGQLKEILGLDREWRVALIGVGRLGRALLNYRVFVERGFRWVAAFDTDVDIVGKRFAGVQVQHLSELPLYCKEKGISIGVVAVPAPQAQEVVDRLVECGIKSILNYAPIDARVPPGVVLRNIDPILFLEEMTYYLALPGKGS